MLDLPRVIDQVVFKFLFLIDVLSVRTTCKTALDRCNSERKELWSNVRYSDHFMMIRDSGGNNPKFIKFVMRTFKSTKQRKEFVYLRACKLGQIDLVEWLLKSFDELYQMDRKYLPFIKSCESTNTKIIVFIMEQTGLTAFSPVRGSSMSAFRHAVLSGLLDVVKWMAERFQVQRGYILRDYCYVLLRSCEKGYLRIAQWLIEHYNLVTEIHADNNYAFIEACRNGHLNVAMWIYETYFRNQVKEKNIVLAIEIACSRAILDCRLEILDWMYDYLIIDRAKLIRCVATIFEKLHTRSKILDNWILSKST